LDEFVDLAGRGSVCRGGPLKMTQADSINVQVDGPLVFNVTTLMLKAALAVLSEFAPLGPFGWPGRRW
jgi:hypothetical protein